MRGLQQYQERKHDPARKALTKLLNHYVVVESIKNPLLHQASHRSAY